MHEIGQSKHALQTSQSNLHARANSEVFVPCKYVLYNQRFCALNRKQFVTRVIFLRRKMGGTEDREHRRKKSCFRDNMNSG